MPAADSPEPCQPVVSQEPRTAVAARLAELRRRAARLADSETAGRDRTTPAATEEAAPASRPTAASVADPVAAVAVEAAGAEAPAGHLPAAGRRTQVPEAAEPQRMGALEAACRTSLASSTLPRARAIFIKTASIASISSALSARVCRRWRVERMGKPAPIKWPSTTPARVPRTQEQTTGFANLAALRTSAPAIAPTPRSSHSACSRCGTKGRRRRIPARAAAFRSMGTSST
jgi:hypothetical protein